MILLYNSQPYLWGELEYPRLFIKEDAHALLPPRDGANVPSVHDYRTNSPRPL